MGGFMTGFTAQLGSKVMDRVRQQEDAEAENRKNTATALNAALQHALETEYPDDADGKKKQAAIDNILQTQAGLYKHSKPLQQVFQKFGQVLHMGRALHKAQQGQGQGQPMSETTPIGGSSTQLPATPGGATTPQPTKPDFYAGANAPPRVPTPPPGPPTQASAAPATAKGGGPTPPPSATGASPKDGGKEKKPNAGAPLSRSQKVASALVGAYPAGQAEREEQQKIDFMQREAKEMFNFRIQQMEEAGIKKGSPEYYQILFNMKPPSGKWTQARTEPIPGETIGKPPGTFWTEWRSPDGQIDYAPSAPPKKVIDPVVKSLVGKGMIPQFDGQGNITGVTPLPGYEEFQKRLNEAKQTAGKNTGFMTMYAVYRLIETGYRENPALLPYLGELAKNAFEKAGLKVPEGFIEAIGTMPRNMPEDIFGNYIGTHMPGSPLAQGQINSSGLFAQRFIATEKDIRKSIEENRDLLGPISGRAVMHFLVGEVGSTGNEEWDRRLEGLRTDMTLVATNLARLHINAVRPIEKFESIADEGKMSPEALLGYLDEVHKWAWHAVQQGQGKSILKGRIPEPPGTPSKTSSLDDEIMHAIAH